MGFAIGCVGFHKVKDGSPSRGFTESNVGLCRVEFAVVWVWGKVEMSL